MSRKMSLAREIQIQKKQNKNRMVGETFNPSGITGKEIDAREKIFVQNMKNLSHTERAEYWRQVKEIIEYREENNIHCSWAWEWCSFNRHFVFNDEVI